MGDAVKNFTANYMIRSAFRGGIVAAKSQQ
jgi:hypothetical protein